MNTPDMREFFSDIDDEVYFLLSGESDVANCALRILQQIKDKRLTIIYVKPSIDFLDNKKALQEKAIRCILQEYTRSGLFEKMILLDIQEIESIMGDVSVRDYETKFLQTVFTLVNTYRKLSKEELVIDQSNKPKDIARIISLGYYDFLNSDKEKMAYHLDNVDSAVYHFYLTDKTLNENMKILKQIKEKVKNKAIDNTRVSYTIARTQHESDYCFTVYYSKEVEQPL
jgi:hypothetical protein